MISYYIKMYEKNHIQSTKINLPKITQQKIDLEHWYDQNNNQMINSFQIIGILGIGAYAKVYKAKRNSEFFALKVYYTRELSNTRYVGERKYSSNLQLLQLQMEITQVLNHKNLVRCYQILENKSQMITVNQLGDLGDLMVWSEIKESYSRNQDILKYISNKYTVKQLINVMQIIFKQISQGIAYLHTNNITHRDIKPTNIIAKITQHVNDQIKLIDFNTSRVHVNNDLSYYPAGTPGFKAPQHQFGLAQGYSSKASDIWSLGIMMYVYYHEQMPFKGQTTLQMDISAKNNKIQFSEECPQFLANLIKKMTQKSWKQRISIEQVIRLIQKWDTQ